MTDRKQALQDLRDKVAAGACDHGSFIVMGKPMDGIMAHHAYDGSLDAAKALHNAVLPGCSQYSIVTDPTCLKVSVCWWPNGLSEKTERHGEGWGHPDQEARAWLLAILSALIAQQTDTTKEAT